MGNISVDLASRLCTSNAPVAQSFEKPSFEYKNNIFYNGYIQNTYAKEGEGVLLTSGKSLTVEASDNGAKLVVPDTKKSYSLPFQYLLTKHINVEEQMAGEMVCHTYLDNKVYTIYGNNDVYSLIITDEDGKLISQKDLDCTSAIISSVYNLDDKPLLFTLDRELVGTDLYANHIKAYNIDDLDTEILSYETTDYIPLGDVDSATIRMVGYKKVYMCGFEDTDKNRTKTIVWTNDGSEKWTTRAKEYKWFGVVSVRGDITGEPIPDPDMLSEPSRQSNGTYAWDLWDTSTSKYKEFDLIGGYYVDETLGKLQKIVIDTSRAGAAGSASTNATMLRTNISVNDSKLDDDELVPMRYFISNYADSKDVYYSYGPGWLKTYVRISSTITPTATSGDGKIFDCYMYTFGCKTDNFLNTGTLNGRIRKESVMAKGTTKEWDYSYGKLNQRIYTVGGTNKGTESLLATIPFTVEVIPSEYEDFNNIRNLDMQMYSLMPLSYSYRKTLITTASNDNSEHFTILTNGNGHTVLCVNEDIYVIDKYEDYTTAYKSLIIDKVADFNYRTNVLDEKNLITEDRAGNVEIVRSFYPYNMEGILDIEDLKLTIPSKTETDKNNTWYWAAGNNIQLTDGNSCSYLLPVISIPLFIDTSQLDQFTEETLEKRSSIINPLLKGLYDEYENVDIYYTVATTSTVVYYKTTNVLKTNSTQTDYALYGSPTFNIDNKSTYYWPASSDETVNIFPIGIGSSISGVNYITPTIDLLDNYACRLYTQNNKLFMCYNYANQIYYGSQIFTIYGGNYYYDGQGIYYIGSDNNYSSNQFVCYALGLDFLSNSGSEAYFYSDWEKRLFVFTGSNTMQPADSLTNVGLVTDSVYSSKEQMLYMLTDDNKLIMRSSTDTAGIVDIPDGASLIGTNAGAGVVYDNSSKYILFSPREKDGYDYLPYKLETEYLGLDGKNLKCHSVDFLIYNIDPKNTIKLTMKVHTLAGIEDSVEVQNFVITPKDWKGRTYRCRITPRVNTGNAFKAVLESDNKIAVSYLGYNLDDLDKATAAPRSGRR